MNRFFIPSYITNSIRIKLKAMRLRSKHGKYPYEVLKNSVVYGNVPTYNTLFSEVYHSFAYFDLTRAKKHYGNRKQFIIDVMYAILSYNDMIKRGEIDKNKLVEYATSIGKKATYKDGLPHFLVKEDYKKFDLKGEVISGIIQAKVSSFFLRAYSATSDVKYLGWSKSALLACLKPRNQGGIMISSDGIKSWIEEYDTDKPSMVLNGFVFVLIAAAEYLSFEEDYHIRKALEDGLTTLLAWLPQFRQGDDYLYSMYHWDISNVNYLGVMKYQFEHLYKVTQLQELTPIIDHLKENKHMDTFHKIMGVQ